MKRWQKILIILVIVVPILLFVLATGATCFFYSYYFSQQMDISYLEPKVEDFDGLLVDEGSFEGNKGQELKSFLYYTELMDEILAVYNNAL